MTEQKLKERIDIMLHCLAEEADSMSAVTMGMQEILQKVANLKCWLKNLESRVVELQNRERR